MALQTKQERISAIKNILEAKSVLSTGDNGKLEERIKTDNIMGDLLGDTSAIYQYTMQHSDELKELILKDKRIGRSNIFDEMSQKYISAEDIAKFALDYAEYIDYKKFLLFIYHNFKTQTADDLFLSGRKNEILDRKDPVNLDNGQAQMVKLGVTRVENKLRNLIDKYISKDELIEIYGVAYDTQKDEITFTYINSDSELSTKHKKEESIKDYINDDDYTFAASFIKKGDLTKILKNDDAKYIIDEILYPELLNNYKSENFTVLKILNDKNFQKCIDKDKYSIIAEYRILTGLAENTRNGASLIDDNFSENYILKTVKLLSKLDEMIDENSKIDKVDKAININKNTLKLLKDNTLEEFLGQYLLMYPEKAYFLADKSILNKSNLFLALGKVSNPERLVSILYNNNTLSRDDVNQLTEDYQLNIDLLHKEELNTYLKNQGISFNASGFDKIKLDDDNIYSMLSNEQKKELVSFYMKQLEEGNQPNNNLKKLISSGEIDVPTIKKELINGVISEEALRRLIDYIKDNNLMKDNKEERFDFSKLNFSIKELVKSYKIINHDYISEALKKDDIDYENIQLSELELKNAKTEYAFQLKLFEKEHARTNMLNQSEIMDQLDFVGLNAEIIEDLYKKGIINIHTLIEYGDDAGEIPQNRLSYKLYKEELLKKGDERAVVELSDEIDNPMVLIKLKEDNQINNKEIISKYLKGQISEDTMFKYSENINIGGSLSKDQLLKLFSKATRSSEKDALEEFKKYSDLYNKCIQDEDEEIIKEETKIVKGYANDNNIEKLYSNGLVSAEILGNISDLGIANILANNGLINSSDAKKIFRDSDGSHDKRCRLEKIFTNFKLNNDQKMSILLSIYGNSINQENQNITPEDEENFNYFMDNGYIDIDTYQTQCGSKEDRQKNIDRKDRIQQTEQSIMPFLQRSAYLNHLDPKSTVEIVSTTYVSHLQSYHKVLFEQICSKRKGTTTSDLTSHATYILDGQAYEKSKKELYIENGATKMIDWHKLTEMYKQNEPGVAKATHHATSWEKSIISKIQTDDNLDKKTIQKKIDNTQGKEK